MNVSWLKPLLRKSGQAIVRNSPHLLMGFGTAYSLAALIFAAKAAPGANKELWDKKTEETAKYYGMDVEEVVEKVDIRTEYRKLPFSETFKILAKHYGPAAAMELLALICFWAAHGIDIRRQAVLSGLCATAEQALREYQQKTIQMFGKDVDKDIRNSIAKDQVERLPAATNNFYIDSGAEETFIYRGQRFRSTYNRLKESENLANKQMINDMYISELELIWLLDPERKYLKPDDDSGQVGWSIDEFITLDICWVPNENHRPEGVINVVDSNGMRYPPSPGFSKMH